jgi:DNA polymerase III epsilon subunit-like protein
MRMREIVFDTETTGFEPGEGHAAFARARAANQRDADA